MAKSTSSHPGGHGDDTGKAKKPRHITEGIRTVLGGQKGRKSAGKD